MIWTDRYEWLVGAITIGLTALVVAPGPAIAQIAMSEDTVAAFDRALAEVNDGPGGPLIPSGIAMEMQDAGGQDAGTELINGTIVDATFFPGVVRPVTDIGACTGSLLGPATLLIAAHCFSSDVSLISFAAAGRTSRALCEVAPGFDSNRSDDWALCILEHRITGLTYETVNMTSVPGPGTEIMLTGYGCTAENQAPARRPLKAGMSKIIARSTAGGDRSYIFSKSDREAGEAILCPGDSGGPVFRLLGNTVSDRREIVAVNSRSNISLGLGLLSATASPAGVAFFRDWSARNEQTICGLNPAAGQRCM